MTPSVEVIGPSSLADIVVRATQRLRSVEDAEQLALAGELESLLRGEPCWEAFRSATARAWRAHDHVVLRAWPLAGDGISALIAACSVGRTFRSYRGRRVVKRLTASPWTTELSHTLLDGHFHTDLNTADVPPAVTIIQCITSDPGGHPYGHLRVARLAALLAALEREGATGTLRFLRDEVVTMVNDSAPSCWRGNVADETSIRFHPETLRAAVRRYGEAPPGLEEHLAVIHAHALAVSRPIQLEPGDVLLVSNRRALHYRSECTVRFRSFPTDFDSRTVYVLHTMDEVDEA